MTKNKQEKQKHKTCKIKQQKTKTNKIKKN